MHKSISAVLLTTAVVVLPAGSAFAAGKSGSAHKPAAKKVVSTRTYLGPGVDMQWEWTIPHYVRKFAILRAPLPRQVQFAKRVYHSLKRVAGRGNCADKDTTPKMFQSG